ncbi:MAG: elongation factor 1-beta [Candidatus Nitrosocaldaceae archaeon]|nr:MAG: elongation factor 1-beta [Candidatus Nitrosocaldaceae archaeon]
MARLIVRIKILPEDIETNLDELKNNIESSLPDGMAIKASNIEPIAFGLNALIIDFAMDDKEGQMEQLEDKLKTIKGVSEIQIVNLSRESATL